MEGNWETGPRVPLVLFAIPDEEARENRFELGIPGGASLILKHDIDGVVPGLNDFVAEDGTVLHPPVTPLFFAFRIMVGVGFAMLFISWAGAWMIWRRGDINRPMAYVLVPMALSGWVATLAGWYTTEIGRQPWLVRWRAQDRGRRGGTARNLRRHHACGLPAGLCGPDRSLSVGDHCACAQGREDRA
jgi:cytochrome d ubiquinol oxidase subunit I